jgi:hypothetical protein
VQVDPIKPTLKAPGTKRLKLELEKPISKFAFKFNLRHYNWAVERIPWLDLLGGSIRVADAGEVCAELKLATSSTACQTLVLLNGGMHRIQASRVIHRVSEPRFVDLN